MAISDLRSLSELARKPKTKAGKEVLVLDTSEVIAKDDQVRKQFDGIDELAHSLRVNGQVQPIIVYPRNEKGLYVIQKGERRWRAAKIAGLSIEAIVDDKPYTALDETAGELVENIQRDALTPLEIAQGLQKFVDEGWKRKQIAERLGKPASYISAHLSLLKMPECVQTLYAEDITRDPETLNNLRLLYEIDPERGEIACAQAATNGIGRKQSRELLNSAKKPIAKKEPEPSVTSEPLIDDGTTNDSNNTTHEEYNVNLAKGVDYSNSGSNGNSPNANVDDVSSSTHGTGQTWKKVVPSLVKVYVSITSDDGTKFGYIATDRVDEERDYCWVNTQDGHLVRVHVSDTQLIYIEA